MTHSTLHIVSVAHDAMLEGRLLDAFELLGPAGEGACEFEHHRTVSPTDLKANWQSVYDEEEFAAYYESRPVDYDTAGAAHREWLREWQTLLAKADWKRGIMTELLKAANLGSRFVYTLRARKEKGETLDVTLSKKLLERGASDLDLT